MAPKRKCTKRDDLYQVLDTAHFPRYAQRLRQLGVLDDLSPKTPNKWPR